MSGLSAEEPGSSPPTRSPDGAPSSPPEGEARSPAARVACAREWTDELCVLGCVRDWECARLSENACRDGEKIQIQHLKRNKIEKRNNEVSKDFRKEILPLKEADPQIPERKNFG